MMIIGPKKSNSQSAHLTWTEANLERAHSRLVGRRDANMWPKSRDYDRWRSSERHPFWAKAGRVQCVQADNQESKSGQEPLQRLRSRRNQHTPSDLRYWGQLRAPVRRHRL